MKDQIKRDHDFFVEINDEKVILDCCKFFISTPHIETLKKWKESLKSLNPNRGR